jgi:D-threonate/D-erythronate kinase
MKSERYIPQIALIADDLTGSLDTGLQFRKKGLAALVPLDWNRPYPRAEALVLNTNSRNLSGDLAYRKVFRICRRLKARGIYKNIDSTMRGNVGTEALAILNAQKIAKAIVVPTVPVMGRAVEGGILRVHGTPLLKTAYARDPFHPIWTSRVSSLLEKETGEPVGFIGIKEVRKGPSYLAQKIQNTRARLLSLDAVLQSDLKIIAQACNLLPGQVLPCGSVGLADELNLPFQREDRKLMKKGPRRPLLIISASRNPTTANQIEIARNHSRFPLVEPDLGRLTNPRTSGSEAKAAAQRLVEALSKGDGAILTTTFQDHLPGKEKVIPKVLGRTAVHLLGKLRLGGLVLTGGDLAMGVCERLSSSALRIEEEVLPGIPCSTLTGGPFKGLRMVTKAGGFGEKDALWRIIQYLRGAHEQEG